MVSIWKTFRSMRDGHCRESGRSSEARCREVPLYIIHVLLLFAKVLSICAFSLLKLV